MARHGVAAEGEWLTHHGLFSFVYLGCPYIPCFMSWLEVVLSILLLLSLSLAMALQRRYLALQRRHKVLQRRYDKAEHQLSTSR